MAQHDIGLVGLAVMGQNLVLNMANHGFSVAVFNRTTSKTDEFVTGPAKGKSIAGYHSLAELVGEPEDAAENHDDGQGRARPSTS